MMKQYDSYKDSGVEWIGKIPSHWEVCAFKRKIAINNGRDYKEFLDDELFPVMGSGGCFAYCSKYLYDGEAVLLGRKGTIDKPLYINGKFWAVDTMFYATPLKGLHCKFAYYLALTFPFNYYSTSTALPSMTQSDLGNNPVAIPPFAEQEVMASYLDKKCYEIDKAIATQEKRVELLKELRQNIITQAVTRGINPNAPLKDSGVEWIGKVPEHWAIKRIKHCAQIFGRIGFRGYTTQDLVLEGEGPITLSPSNMQVRMNYDSCTYLSWFKYNESPEIQIHNGDVLFVKTGSTYGKSAYVENLPMEATINPQIVVFKNFKECCGKYFYYLLTTDIVQSQVDNTVIGSTIPTIGQEKIRNYIIPMPPLSEQQEIVSYIESQTARLDKSIEKAEHQIELLQELKQSIITEVVTGKRKVD